MFSNLEIANFKGFQNIKFDDFKKFNLFIGKNDVGKSTVLESIYAMKASLHSQPNEFKWVLRSHNRQQHGRELWYNHQTTDNPTIKATFDGVECTLTFQSDFSFTNVKVIMELNEKGTCSFNTDSFFSNISGQNNINLLDTLESSFKSGFSEMIFIHELFLKNSSIWEGYVQTGGSNTDEYDPSIQALKSSSYTQGGSRLALRKNNHDLFIDGFGDGHKSGLALLNVADSLENTVILVEEIETHQHPSSLRDIITKFIEKCQTNNNQAFITTHSPEVLQLFEKNQDAAFFHLQKNQDSITTNQIKPDDLDMMKDVGWNIGNFLRYEKIIVVEGTTDQVIFRHSFYKLKNFWPEEVGIIFLPAGDNNTKQKELVKGLAYYDKKIFVQRDKDDKEPAQIEQSVFEPFINELQSEGYTKNDNDEEIIMKNNLGLTKRLIKKNLIITGMPTKFPDIKKHATDDYLIQIIQNQPDILEKIPSNKTLPKLTGNNSKEILEQTFGHYDSSIAEKIISNANPESIPEELSTIIQAIYSS